MLREGRGRPSSSNRPVIGSTTTWVRGAPEPGTTSTSPTPTHRHRLQGWRRLRSRRGAGTTSPMKISGSWRGMMTTSWRGRTRTGSRGALLGDRMSREKQENSIQYVLSIQKSWCQLFSSLIKIQFLFYLPLGLHVKNPQDSSLTQKLLPECSEH